MIPNTFALLTMMAVLLGFGGLLAFALVVLQARSAGRMQNRLQAGVDGNVGDEFSTVEAQSWIAVLARRGRRVERLLDTEGEADKLLIQAGWRDPAARLGVYASQAVAPVVVLFLAIAWWLSGDTRGIVVLLVSSALLIASLLAPMWTLRRVAAARRQHIKNEVPLFIHLLVLLFE